MSIYPKVTEQGLLKIGKLAEQQNSHRVFKTENKASKQTSVKKLAEAFSSRT